MEIKNSKYFVAKVYLLIQQDGGGTSHWPMEHVDESVPFKRSGSGQENIHVDPSWLQINKIWIF